MRDFDKIVGENLAKWRTLRGFSLKEAATFLGYSESYLSYIEAGKRSIKVKDLRKLQMFYGLKYQDFLP